jgi:SpoVK/Ycf46/Vps4 family AAA+-type ATPase
MLVPLGGSTWLLQHEEFYASDQVAQLVGLPDSITKAEVPARHRALRDAWVEAEARAAEYRHRQPFARNLEKLSQLFGLDRSQRQVLALALTAGFDQVIEPILADIPALSRSMTDSWAKVLGLPRARLRQALSSRSRLGRAGLFQMECPLVQAVSAIQVNRPELAGAYSDPDWRPDKLLAGLGREAPPPELERADYPHLAGDVDLMISYLRTALARRRKGVNILLHGMPGSGKTQLARLLGRELGVTPYEVETSDADGDASSGSRRLSMLSNLQSLLTGRKTLIVFDEIDQIFADGNWFTGVRTTADRQRGWLVDQLESNPIPTIWIGNDVRSVDPAYARRFDIVLEMSTPPRGQRSEMIRRHAGSWLAETQVRRLAQVEALSPATVRRAVRVVSGAGLRRTHAGRAMERLIDQSLRVQSRNPQRDPIPPLQVAEYEPALSHASADLEVIAEGLSRTGEGRLCLYGPPGTGKSAFGLWLGERLGRPVVLQRGSDLLSAYVGETEANIAKAFKLAQRDGAILQIDEVDSFLANRDQANHRWEASMVNEMLTQMESFTGIFIATTNLMKGLDPAAMRRFDAKILFDYLLPNQAWLMLRRLCEQCDIELLKDKESLQAKMAAIKALTPGDFAAVARRHRFETFRHAQDLVAALEAECRIKPGMATRRMGFV